MKSQVAYLNLLKTNGAILLNQKLNSKNRLITEGANIPKEAGLCNIFTERFKCHLNDL
jgi:mannitol/fructose-specific phosphotransferase system IIA component (Ntr-type)